MSTSLTEVPPEAKIELQAGDLYALVGWVDEVYRLLEDLKETVPQGNEQNDELLTRIARAQARAVELLPEVGGEPEGEPVVEQAEQAQPMTESHYAAALALALELAELFTLHNGEPARVEFVNSASDTISRLRAILPESAIEDARAHSAGWEEEGW